MRLYMLNIDPERILFVLVKAERCSGCCTCPLLAGPLGSVWSGGVGSVWSSLPLWPDLQPAHRLHSSPPPPGAGRLPHCFWVRPVPRVPGGRRGGLVGAAVAEEPAEVADGPETDPRSSGPEQNLHQSRVSSLHRSGQNNHMIHLHHL